MFVYTYARVPCVWCKQRPEEGVGYPETGVTEGWEPSCGCWELNLGPLQEQPELLTAEPSLWFYSYIFLSVGVSVTERLI